MIRKAVLPVAGLGTRCLPASKAIPKEMITIVDKPVIQYVVEEAVAAGIKEIVLVTHSSKNAIENHFDKHFELETTLEAKGKFELLEELRNIIPDDVKIISVRQPEPLGLGHAVLCAKSIVGDEPFIVMLPDVVVDGEGLEKNDLTRMMEAYEATGAAQIMVENVPQEMAYKYGIVAIDGEAPEAGKSALITGMVEKPAPGTEPSTLAVIGRYLLPGRIFELLEQTPPGAGGEIQLTDAIDALRDDKAVAAYRMAGDTYDCGHQLGYLEATISFAKRHPKFGEGFRELLARYQEK